MQILIPSSTPLQVSWCIWGGEYSNRGQQEGKTAHNQVRLHFSGLLVGVRHEAAHKVRLAVVQLRTSGHQAIKTIKAKMVEHSDAKAVNVKRQSRDIHNPDLSHQLHEGDKINGGDRLPAAFLLLLSFFFWGLVGRFRQCETLHQFETLLKPAFAEY